MSINISHESNEKQEKSEPKVKIGKDIYIYRTLYLITKEEIFKNKSKRSINFYLKNQYKEKSLINLPKPQDSDIIIEEIKELIELILSLCILTNSANYKISLFTSSFGNIENNIQLLKYQGKIIYAKLNEFKKNDNEEKINFRFFEYNEPSKKDNDRQSLLRKKSKTVKEYPTMKLKKIFPYKQFLVSSLNNNEKENGNNSNDSINQEKDTINNEEKNYIYKNNSFINKIKNNQSKSYYNIIPHLPNLKSYDKLYNNNNSNIFEDSSNREKIINSHSFLFMDNFHSNKNNNLNNTDSLQEKNKFNLFSNIKPTIKKDDSKILFNKNNQMIRSNSTLNFNSSNNTAKKYFWRTLHKSSSFQFFDKSKQKTIDYNKNGINSKETNYSFKNLNNNNTNFGLKSKVSRNKIIYKTKYFSPFRFSYFSKGNTIYNKNINNNFTDYQNIKNIFSKKANTSLRDNEKKDKKILAKQENINLIKNFLFKPSIITISKNNFYDPRQKIFNNIKNIFYEFKYELKKISHKLNNYVSNKEIEIYINDLDTIFKLLGIDLTYCLKEYCLYSYFDKYIKENFPAILDNFLYDPNITTNQISEVLNSLLIHIHKFQNEERFNLVEYVRTLKSIKKCKLSSDFFEIFVLCPNYFELTKREVTKKIALVLEIDCITNNVTIENFINYYYIFKYGHLVKLDKKLLFINKLLHMIEGKGGPLQEKIFSDIQYLFKIDNRTKQLLLGRTFDIKINFHLTLKINQIFDSIVDYFSDSSIKKFEKLNIEHNNTSNFSSISKL